MADEKENDMFTSIRKRQQEIFGSSSPLVAPGGPDQIAAMLAGTYRMAQGMEPIPFDALPEAMQSVWRRVAQASSGASKTSASVTTGSMDVLNNAFEAFRRKTGTSFCDWLTKAGYSSSSEQLARVCPKAAQYP